MDYSRENLYSTIHLCWGALAGLYYHFGVRKVHLPEKMFGVFEHRVVRPSNPLVRGFDEVFYAPHSRWAGLNRADIDAAPELLGLRTLLVHDKHVLARKFAIGGQLFGNDQRHKQ